MVLRGPAGSGKSTIAKAVVASLLGDGRPTCYLEQDLFRNTLLKGKGDVDSASVSATMLMSSAKVALKGGYCVVLEGILNCNQDGRGKYRPLLEELVVLATEHGVNLKLIYLSLPIEVTKNRHLGRAKAKDFGVEKLDDWWASSAPSELAGEVCINTQSQSVEESVEVIMGHLKTSYSDGKS